MQPPKILYSTALLTALVLSGCTYFEEDDDAQKMRIAPMVVRQHSLYDYPEGFEASFDLPLETQRPEDFLVKNAEIAQENPQI